MLNKNKILMMAVAGAISNFPSDVSAQTFYQCMPCGAGSYDSNGKCTKCPVGTYSDELMAKSSSVCKKCPAGTYSMAGSTSCTPCPDYKWSNEGSGICSPIQFKVCYYHKNPKSNQYAWRSAGITYNCSNKAFGFDPNKGEHKYCAIRRGQCGSYWVSIGSEGGTFNLDCKSLPCRIDEGNVYIEFNTDKSITYCSCSWYYEDDDDYEGEKRCYCDNYPNEFTW